MFFHLKKKKKPLPTSLVVIKKDLKKKSKSRQKLLLLPDEEEIIEEILQRTRSFNRNNVTRTKAYLDFYHQYPEIHWAFLGHMVSRNGGYAMTDLKGEYLSRLMSKKEREIFFSFLERGNWLIFQDVYPQFLIYETSVKQGQPYFHLLPHLEVSIFMESIWNYFWETFDEKILALSLIINEQNYLESRVIQNPLYQKEVFHTLEFKLQDILALNHVFFPYIYNGKTKLVGATLHHFEDLTERILLGKRLYAILFGDPKRRKLIEQWANENPHTGSRKDYWPELFNHVNESTPGISLKPRLRSCRLTKGSPRIYSPKLELVWKNREHEAAESGDWFKSWKVLEYLIDSEEKGNERIVHEYCKTLEKLEFAAAAKKAMSILD